jgi:hypothetical protein
MREGKEKVVACSALQAGEKRSGLGKRKTARGRRVVGGLKREKGRERDVGSFF